MNKYIVTLAAAVGLMAAPALATDKVSTETKASSKVEQKADGSYSEKREVTQEHKDAAGTKTSTETKVEVKVDEEGEGKKTVKTEAVTDPKGLMNKSKTVTTDTETHKDGKVEMKHEKKVDGKVVEENKVEATR